MTRPTQRSVVLMFPGTGAQHPRMAAGLYRREPVFTAAVDAVLGELGAEGEAVRADWLADVPAVPLEADARSAPLLFAVDYAVGRLVESWGCGPRRTWGTAWGVRRRDARGVFRLEDAVRLLWDRVERQRATPVGGMTAVAAARHEVAGYLGAGVVVGAVNGPRHTVLSGPEAPLRAVEERLASDGRTFRRLATRTPYHSPALAPLVPGGAALVSRHAALRSPHPSLLRLHRRAVARTGGAGPRLLGGPADGPGAVLADAGPGAARRRPAAGRGRALAQPLGSGQEPSGGALRAQHGGDHAASPGAGAPGGPAQPPRAPCVVERGGALPVPPGPGHSGTLPVELPLS